VVYPRLIYGVIVDRDGLIIYWILDCIVVNVVVEWLIFIGDIVVVIVGIGGLISESDEKLLDNEIDYMGDTTNLRVVRSKLDVKLLDE
jgi:hypothetical protein